MARWKLTEDHYLNVRRVRKGATEWEYRETDRTSGEEERVRFVVPLYCEKEWIVCAKGSEHPEDNGRIGPVIFDGEAIPGPAMEPLDDEAKAISASLEHKWIHPIDNIPSQGGFSATLLAGLEKQLDELSRKLPPPQPVAASGVTREEFEALQTQLAALLAEKVERDNDPKGRRKVA